MIITEKKPPEELLAMLEGVERVALVGCGSCAAACKTGGAPELEEMKAFLEANGKKVVGTILPDECCHKLLVKREVKALRDSGAEAVVGLSCGDGVQTVADNVALPVYPACNTLFLGQVERVGMYREYCRMCGDCVLGETGGICPVTRCAKSLVNGPCGGAREGKCEADPANDCAWVLIYRRLEATGQLEKLGKPRRDKGYAGAVHPGRLSIRGKQA